MLPFSIYMSASFFRTIPPSMIEAATVDGASSYTVFRLIVLPLSARAATLAVINPSGSGTRLLIALFFLQDDSKKTSSSASPVSRAAHNLNVPAIMAGLSAGDPADCDLYLFGQRFFVRGLCGRREE